MHRGSVSNRRRRRLLTEVLEPRQMLAVDWRNPVDSLDVNGDANITPLDALLIINHLNSNTSSALPDERPRLSPFLDVTGDQQVVPLDVLLVINHLNSYQSGVRLLSEGNDLSSDTDVVVTLNGLFSSSTRRTYRVQIDASFDQSDSQAVEDILAVYLVSPANSETTILDRGENGTALLALMGNRAEYATGLVRWDGKILEIDTTQAATETGLLKFQLISSDRDTGTRVTVRPLSHDVELSAPSALVSQASVPLVVRTGDTPLPLQSLTTGFDVSLTASNVRYNTVTGKYEAELRLQSHDVALTRDVAVALTGLPTGVVLTSAAGVTSDGHPYVNFRDSLPPEGLRPGMHSQPLNIEITSPDNTPFVLTPRIHAAVNRPPVFHSIATQSVMPGGVLRVNLSGSDPEGNTLAFNLRSQATLPNVQLSSDGELVFRPAPNQLGSYQLDAIISDGALEATQTFRVDVIADPVTSTRVSGTILKVDGAPLANMRVEIGAVEALTNAAGAFTLDLGTGIVATDTLRVRGDLFNGASAYPFIGEKLPLLLEHELYLGVNNVISRPIYLPELDVQSGQAVDPSITMEITSDKLPGSAVTIEAGTLFNQQSIPFTGVLSITQVPRHLTPAALPPGLIPDLVVTIQPGEMVFSTPAPLALPNQGGYTPGALMDLWSINPTIGQFEKVGIGQVSNDGEVITTVSGGIRNSSWHFFSPPPELVRPAENEVGNQQENCQKQEACQAATSHVELHSGALREQHSLVSYHALGQDLGLTLFYDSQRADPRPIINFGIDNARGGSDRFLVGRLSFSDGIAAIENQGYPGGQGLLGGEHFWILPDGNNHITVALQADMRSVRTGVYDYHLDSGILRLTDDDTFVGTTSASTGQVVVVNERTSPLGAGWQLGGLQQLAQAPGGSILLVDGDGTNLLFTALIGQPGRFVSPPGDFTELIRHANGSYTRTTKDKLVYHFDTTGKLLSVTDRNQNTLQYVYSNNRLSAIVDPVGLQTQLAYNTDGKVSTITDPAGRVTSLRYDSVGNLVRITDPDGSQRNWQYDADHHMIGEIDQNGAVESAEYGFHGRALSAIRKDGSRVDFAPLQAKYLQPVHLTISPVTAPLAPVTQSVTADTLDGSGNRAVTVLDQAGQAVSMVDQIGQQPIVERNADNQITSTLTGRGNLTTFEYDDRGNLVSVVDEVLANARRPDGLFPGHMLQTDGASSSQAIDVDADGILDWVLAGTSIQILLGNGDGTFNQPILVELQYHLDELQPLVDLNLDGYLDMVVETRFYYRDFIFDMYQPAVEIYMGRGDGHFEYVPGYAGGTRGGFNIAIGFFDTVTADFNQDTLPDVLVADSHFGLITLLVNLGNSTFQSRDIGSLPSKGPTKPLVVDLDRNGIHDLVFSHMRSTSVTVAMNTTSTALGNETALFTTNELIQHFELTDVDGDAREDMVLLHSLGNPTSPGSISIHRGNGDGTFGVEATFEVGLAPSSFDVADINHDGHADIVVSFSYASYGIALWLGSASGNFVSGGTFTGIDTITSYQSQLRLADFNADGWQDALVFGMLFLGNANSLFTNAVALDGGGSGTSSTVIADFNGDSHLDYAGAGSLARIRLGKGDGTFDSPVQHSVSGGLTNVIAADLDADGLNDLIAVSNNPHSLAITLGSANPNSALTSLVALEAFPLGPMLTHDVDRDGHLDLLLMLNAGPSYWIEVRLGNGDGTFQLPTTIYNDRSLFDMVLADVDFDGDQEVIAIGTSSSAVIARDQDGLFEPIAALPATSRPAGDLDGDEILPEEDGEWDQPD